MKGTPTWLRAQNDRTAFRLLLEHGPLSRTQLGELSGLSKPTAGQMIARLERVGLIGPVGEITGARGPNAVAYGVRRDTLTGVAVSILADRLQAVLVDPTDGQHPVVDVPTAQLDRSPAGDVTAAVHAACAAAGVAHDRVSAVTIGVQAAVDAPRDELSYADTLPGWPLQGARTLIATATGLDVTIENDVNLAALAVRAAGAVTGDFVYLWLGDGIGAGVFLGGVLHRGFGGGAGELGYLEVPASVAARYPGVADFTDLTGAPGVLSLAGEPPSRAARPTCSTGCAPTPGCWLRSPIGWRWCCSRCSPCWPRRASCWAGRPVWPGAPSWRAWSPSDCRWRRPGWRPVN